MASGWKGSHPSRHIYDCLEYETLSKQYENGPITYFEVTTGLPRLHHNTSPPWWAAYICRNMGNSGKSRFNQREHESKMRVFKTHSHTSERLGYEARKNAKKSNWRKRRRHDKPNHRQKPPADRQRGGGGETKKGDRRITQALWTIYTRYSLSRATNLAAVLLLL